MADAPGQVGSLWFTRVKIAGSIDRFAVLETTERNLFQYSLMNRGFRKQVVEGQILALDASGDQLWLIEQRGNELYLGKTTNCRQIDYIKIPHADALLPESGGMHLAVEGDNVAFGNLTGQLFYSRDGGKTISRTRVSGELTAVCFAQESKGTRLLASIYIESEDKSYLLGEIGDNQFERLAELSPTTAPVGLDTAEDSGGMGSVTAMAWDKTRSLLWIAGRFGLGAWAPGIPT
jgi:hypothetical protein